MLSVSPLNALVEDCGLSFPDHWGEWENLLAEHPRLLLVASRDMGKSSLISNFYPIHRAIESPGLQVLIISYSETQSMRLISGIKDLIENRGILSAYLLPEEGEDWSKSALHLKNGSKINSLTFGTSGRGGHYDLIIIDDPVKDYAGMDADNQEDYFLRAIVPMCRPDGKIVVTGTYVYPDDLIERIKRNKAYHTAEYPAINAKGEPLWPERWPLDKLAERRAEVGEFGFKREYLLEAIDPEAQFFKRSMFKFYEKPPEKMSRCAAWDPAISPLGDFNGMVVTGTGEDKKTYVLDFAQFKCENVAASIDEFFRMSEAWDVPYWCVETIGFQKLLKDNLYEAMRARNKYLGIVEIKHHAKSKQARVMALQPRIEAGAVLFRQGEHDDIIKEFAAFPRGQHDDVIDAMSMLMSHWDAPRAATVKAPAGSWEYWKNQVEEHSDGWYQGLVGEKKNT